MRNSLSYQQASDNSNRKARKAYDEAIAEGNSIAEAQDAAKVAYEAEMKWYEGE